MNVLDDHCYFGKGEFYRGVINRSETNLKCFDWSLTIEVRKYSSYLAGHNYCRNLGKVKDRPWCYVVDESRKMSIQYCNIPRCGKIFSDQNLCISSKKTMYDNSFRAFGRLFHSLFFSL